MNHIEINIYNNGGATDQDVLRVVRNAINESIKYESDRTPGRHWHDPDKRVELQIKFS